MSGGSRRPEVRGETAIAAYLPEGTTCIAAWWLAASAGVAYQTPEYFFPDRHSASCGCRPITAPHWSPTRSARVMPTVHPRRDAWATIWSVVWIDCGRRMRGIASISSTVSKSFIPNGFVRSRSSRLRLSVMPCQSNRGQTTFFTPRWNQGPGSIKTWSVPDLGQAGFHAFRGDAFHALSLVDDEAHVLG